MCGMSACVASQNSSAAHYQSSICSREPNPTADTAAANCHALPPCRDRRFVLSYFMADDTLSIFEPPLRNSGIIGGKYLERSKVGLDSKECQVHCFTCALSSKHAHNAALGATPNLQPHASYAAWAAASRLQLNSMGSAVLATAPWRKRKQLCWPGSTCLLERCAAFGYCKTSLTLAGPAIAGL